MHNTCWWCENGLDDDDTAILNGERMHDSCKREAERYTTIEAEQSAIYDWQA